MLMLFLGITAFVLFFIYDINNFLWHHSLPRTFFTVGVLLLSLSMLYELYSAHSSLAGFQDVLLLCLSFIFLLALIYTLFFALPFKETYTQHDKGRFVCDKGIYALCRHPGILFFFGMSLFSGFSALPSPELLIHGMIYSVLNLIYAYFQDCITFPRTFTDYREYQQRVPFLLPTRESIKCFCKTLYHSSSKEVNS